MRKFLKLIGAFTVLAMLLSVGMGTYSAAQSETFAIGNFENYYDESDNPSGSEIFGDVDFDSELKVKDATLIQKYVAESVVFNENQEKLADVDGDGIVSVKD
ncbi:MAG: dockerin type I repeat-containing protein, partial [Oscillospiraceae bacterium]|nr:dockerin type I repeat-containing protein [Oscillospiraceae bacterium]